MTSVTTRIPQRRQKAYSLQGRSYSNKRHSRTSTTLSDDASSSNNTKVSADASVSPSSREQEYDKNSQEYALLLIQSIFAEPMGMSACPQPKTATPKTSSTTTTTTTTTDQTYQGTAKQQQKRQPIPLQDYLPALTSSSEFDTQLYALIGLLLRQFVFSWYTKISVDFPLPQPQSSQMNQSQSQPSTPSNLSFGSQVKHQKRHSLHSITTISNSNSSSSSSLHLPLSNSSSSAQLPQSQQQSMFVKELVAICAHVTRNLQERAQTVDWETVLFDDLFILMELHRDALCRAKELTGSRFGGTLSEDLNIEKFDDIKSAIDDSSMKVVGDENKSTSNHLQDEKNISTNETDNNNEGQNAWEPNLKEREFIATYLRLNPHFAIDLNDPMKERRYSQVLMKCFVSLVLPFEERDSDLTRSFVTGIFDDLILRNIVESLSDNFMLWDLVGGIAGASNKNKNSNNNNQNDGRTPENGTNTDGKSTSQIRNNSVKNESANSGSPSNRCSSYSDLLSKVGRSVSHLVAYTTSVFSNNKPVRSKLPIVSQFAIFTFIDNLFGLSFKFPFISAYFKFLFTHLLNKSSKFKHLSNNVLHNVVSNKILTGGNLAGLIKVLRGTFFPTDEEFNTEPRYVPITKDQLDAARKKNKDKIVQALKLNHSENGNVNVKRKTSDNSTGDGSTVCKLLQIDEDVVDDFLLAFNYKVINKVLLWHILDLIFSNLFPELKEQDSSEILDTL
ncbi:unnamed protein product [Ambrosiozyma monospora]|uniref:Unnamed protein product n=1 Tax=Ambrosiozyma monospora TaxID=43982 RepID=A0A9W6YXB4_AMBMO|nr:unnamed protein product [Ambrosiozyma monospora]